MNKVRVCLSILGLTATGLLADSVTKKATAKTIEPPTSNQNWNAKLRYRQIAKYPIGFTARTPQSTSSLITSNTSLSSSDRTFSSVYDIAQKRNHQPVQISYRAADLHLQTAQNIPVPAPENLPTIPPDRQYQQSDYNSPITPPESKYQQSEHYPQNTTPETKYQQPVETQPTHYPEKYQENYPRNEYEYKQQQFQVKPVDQHHIKKAQKLRVIPILGDKSFPGISASLEDTEKFVLQETEYQDVNKWSITPEIGTLGAGFSAKKRLNHQFDARVGVHMGSLGLGEYKNDKGDDKHDDHPDHDSHEKPHNYLSYDSNLNLFNVSTLMDYRPWKNSGFYITSGFVFHNNHVNSDANLKLGDDGYFTYNGNHYTHDDITAVKGKVSFPNKIAPYLGIGWQKPVKYGDKWGLSMNLGVMFPGAPNVELTPQIGNEGLRDQILADTKAEEKAIEEDLKGMGVYPVLSVGVSYHF